MQLKNNDQMDALRESGKRLEKVMQEAAAAIRPGVSTAELDEIAEQKIQQLESAPVFKGYGEEYGKPFPATICTSINDEVVHGIPRKNRLVQDGDLVKIDMGLRFNGMVSDMARTFAVGEVSDEAVRLVRVTEESLLRGISAVRIGGRLSDYAKAVQKHVEENGFSVVRDLVGHGVGFDLHEPPQIPNYYFAGMKDAIFRVGMAVAFEPMVNVGGYEVCLGKDGWVFATEDGSLSAHFEDTVIITDQGIEVVTRSGK
ncbi:MAG: type I methionyl aminopeptidase [Candidatus Moraniibacteriota bacterium]